MQSGEVVREQFRAGKGREQVRGWWPLSGNMGWLERKEWRSGGSMECRASTDVQVYFLK